MTNIIETATTIITSDNKLLYSKRGKRVSSDPGLLTSCIAENVHPEKDNLSFGKHNGLPIFNTVLRGVEEEISPLLRNQLNELDVKLLGISFNSVNFHPSLLFLIKTTFTYEEIKSYSIQSPGKDFIEGNMMAINV